MKLAIRAYAYALLAYTGWRTYDFMYNQMPSDLGNLRTWLSIIFLFTTEIGLILWHEASLKHVTTHEQDTLTKIMVGTDLIGSLAAGIADMILHQTFAQGYKISPLLADFLIYGLPLIVFMNVVATIIFENNDAETQEEKAERAVEFEIHREAIKKVRRNKRVLAAQKSQQIISEIEGRVVGRIDGQFGGSPVQEPIELEPTLSEKIEDGLDNFVDRVDGALNQVTNVFKRKRGRPRKMVAENMVFPAEETVAMEEPLNPTPPQMG